MAYAIMHGDECHCQERLTYRFDALESFMRLADFARVNERLFGTRQLSGSKNRQLPASSGASMDRPERPYQALAKLVRSARISKGIRQRALSRTLNKSEGYVGHLEGGRIRPNVETLKALATALGLVYGELAVDAGYISREEFENPIDEQQLARLAEVGDLSEDEWESVKDFARYIRSRRSS